MASSSLFPEEPPSMLYFEAQARKYGFEAVAGIDEAGRGPLAGPVVAAAVILPADFTMPGLTDSKKLTARQRDAFYPQIRQLSRSVGVGVASAEEIDRLNILQATLLAMQRAVARLACAADYLLVDGITPLPTSLPQKTLKQGDSRSLSIAAASVVAKVVRDRIMQSAESQFPGYGFGAHKGYGTLQHRRAIAELGPVKLHRKSFAGVREYLEDSLVRNAWLSADGEKIRPSGFCAGRDGKFYIATTGHRSARLILLLNTDGSWSLSKSKPAGPAVTAPHRKLSGSVNSGRLSGRRNGTWASTRKPDCSRALTW